MFLTPGDNLTTEKAGFVDTHTHLDFPDFDLDRDELIKCSQAEGIELIINVSSSLKGCFTSLDLARRYEIIYASIGIHPHDSQEIRPEDLQLLEGLVKNEKVIAVGEVGLDFYRDLSPQDVQKELFIKFIDLANRTKLPLIIHSRQAEEETWDILKKNSGGSVKGVVHCFSGSRAFLEKCLYLGLHISFTCNLTYKKSDNLRELVKAVPWDRLLLETDCPYLAPEGARGKRNEPANVKILALAMAQARNCEPDDIALNTTRNAKLLFGIPK